LHLGVHFLTTAGKDTMMMWSHPQSSVGTFQTSDDPGQLHADRACFWELCVAEERDGQFILHASTTEKAFINALVNTRGYSQEAAEATVYHLIAAERAGKDCHGLIRLKPLFDDVFKFSSWSRPIPKINAVSLLTFDGSGIPGYLVASAMLEASIKVAKKTGVCLAVGKNVYPSGYLGYYGRIASEAGLVAHIESSSPSRVTAPGHVKPYVGTNPICRAYPIGGLKPVLIDLATSAITHGDLLLAEATGAALPSYSAVMGDGRPANFVHEFNPTKGDGALLPFGGLQAYKSFALALGVALQSSYGGSPPAATGGGDFGLSILLIDTNRLDISGEVRRSEWISSLSDGKHVRIPGWASIGRAQEWETRGQVPVSANTWRIIRQYLNRDNFTSSN